MIQLEFEREAKDFLAMSERFQDSWTWMSEGFLRFQQKISDPCTKDVINVEYHVVYSVSYQVPMLYLRLHYADGSLVNLERAWDLFPLLTCSNANGPAGNIQEKDVQQKRRELLLSTLTQMDHPILFRPFLCLHPCRTAELLSQMPESTNRVLTFISLMGPYVGLTLNPSYGL